MIFDTRSGGTTTIFDGAFYNYVLDPVSEDILLQSYPFFDDDPQEGLYLIQASEPFSTTLLSTEAVLRLDYIGLENFPFIGGTPDQSIVLIGSDGSLKFLADQSLSWNPAPTGDYLALFSRQGNDSLWIYEPAKDQRLEVYDGDVQWAEWRPDSGAIFYMTDHELHLYNLETTDHILIYAWPDSSILDTSIGWVTLP
jgi:hypothetical protein